jgi:glycerophosphoryl diester phosphodiesterase
VTLVDPNEPADAERGRRWQAVAESRSPVIYAHRGARAYAPENTMLAFRLAVALGADGIECDVQRGADGGLVIIHDDTLDRTTTGKGRVAARPLAALRALDAGRGERIPTLDEVLDFARQTGALLNLELKAETPADAGATGAAMAPVLVSLDAARRDRILVSSFDLAALYALKRSQPWLRVATLHGGREWRRRDMLAPALEMGAEAIHPGVSLVTPRLVRRAHEHGLRVNVWTANRATTIRRLLVLGVDGLVTDYPERAVILRTLAGSGAPRL